MNTPVYKNISPVASSEELLFLSRTAAELFETSPEQNIYEIIGTRLKEIAGEAIIIINEYDPHTHLFHVKSIKGLGDFTENIIHLLKKNPNEMSVTLNDPEAMEILLTGKMAIGPDGLYELSFKTIPEILCRTIEKLLNIGRIYGMGFVRNGKLFGDAIIICRKGKNEKLIEQKMLLIETFVHQSVLALHRKEIEAEKLAAQKIADEHEKQALVGQIAGKMAHDFNNILGIIMGNAELSLIDCQDPATKKTLELIFEQTLRGKNLTRNLVAFARDQEPKQEFFRINEKIDLVINLMRKDLEGIELIKEESAGVPELLADPGMIEHALVNLIQNSIHALSLTVSPRISIRTCCRNSRICLEIEDNGCGIADENLENIYKPAFTLKGSRDISRSYKAGIKGTGYGMSNVKKYITQHKGTISIESKLKSGTKFTICLPVIQKKLTKAEQKQIQAQNSPFEKYILLVEDEPAIAEVQYKILTQAPCNHRVDIAANGKMAMDLFERNTYNIVSLDYVLPGNINGMDVYQHIRKTNKTVPILFISGNIEFLESIRHLMKKDRCVDHLSKPCKNIDYINHINRLLAPFTETKQR